ncbi:MAG: GNAT family N-acetyltransferase [Oscillospiraceae bacterium]|nr:GNAT family N-acetyltransferase [Oscillospiraceae bacterium]
MEHCGTKQIETERLILRRFVIDDAQDMFNNWASDSDVTKFLTWPAHPAVEVTKEIISGWVERYDNNDFYQWAIVPKELSEPIGSIAAVEIKEEINAAHIGYCIGKTWWHQGYTSEALKAVIDYFFDKVGADRVEARHDTNNPHSGMVMKKCGMQYEGTLRMGDRNNTGICDASYYSILRGER